MSAVPAAPAALPASRDHVPEADAIATAVASQQTTTTTDAPATACLAEWIVKSSDVVGLFLETGAGCPLASALYDAPGASRASRAILGSLQPYDERATTQRAVSLETVQAFLVGMQQRYQHHPTLNTLVATSFQLGSSAETRTHGFVGICYKKRTSVYHVSLFEPDWTRPQQIRALGEVGLRLLRWHVARFGSGDEWVAYDEAMAVGTIPATSARVQVDQLWEVQLETGRCAANAKALLSFDDHPMSTQDTVLLFRPGGMTDRLDAAFRGKQHLVVFKGSFNPVTRKHEAILKETLPPSEASVARVFMISIDTVDEGRISADDLLGRIRHLNRLGAYCLVNRRGSFAAAIELLRHRYPQAQLHFPVGQDTRDRMEATLFDSERHPNVHWHTGSRTACSSTRVRELLGIRPADRTGAQCHELRELVSPTLWQSLGVPSWTS
jgi:hypothetical protein